MERETAAIGAERCQRPFGGRESAEAAAACAEGDLLEDESALLLLLLIYTSLSP
jgi:hypothetical protein